MDAPLLTRLIQSLLIGLAISVLLAACSDDEDAPPTMTPTDIPTSVAPPSGQATSTLTPTSDPESTPTTATDTPTATQQATALAEASPTATVPEPTATLAPEPTPVPPALETLRIDLQEVAGGLEQPTGVMSSHDGSGRLFVLERPGRIRIVQDGQVLETPFLDLTDRVGWSSPEQGLLGIAFHPRFVENGQFFVNYTDGEGDTVISRFVVGGEPDVGDPRSEEVILTLDQPANNHNGGHLLFGPDGYLWIGTGDGGAAGDRFGNAQNGRTLLGAMLRIDVDGGAPYTIPPDNPWIDNDEIRDEIWAIALRNPWRYSFDRLTGDLYIADVGQNEWEEVNAVPAGDGGVPAGGLNFGWPITEATHCYQQDGCDTAGLTLPVAEYNHDVGGCSVTGGNVYRGEDFPALQGAYFFADYCSGIVWGLRWDGSSTQMQQLGQFSGLSISSFGEDERGEIYVVDARGGRLLQLVAN